MDKKPRNREFIEDELDETETVRDEEMLDKIVQALRASAKWNNNICSQDN